MQVRTRTWLSFTIIAGLVLIAASRFAFFEPLENAALTISAPVDAALRDAARPVADFVNNMTDINRLSNETQALQEENERLLVEIARLEEAERNSQQLQNLLDVRGAEPNESFIDAAVFAREPSNLQTLVAIDRGRNDGVEEGMIVLTLQGSLVGSVTRVLDGAAWITLLTDPSSAISARIQDSRAEGVVVGATDGSLTMEFVERTADVKEGDVVLTSGLGGNHPPGEFIGRVVDVDQAAQELFQTVRVEPLVDYSRLESVLVLASFLPLEIVEP